MTNLFFKSFLYISYTALKLPSLALDWVRIRVFRLHKKSSVHGNLVNSEEGKYAIFAIYPGTTTTESCLRILDSLLLNKFSVIVVVNRNDEADSWISLFKGSNCVIIERPNIGRDFGAYQAGILYMMRNTMASEIKRLVLINDTNYVSPECQSKFLNTFLGQDDLNCLMKHYQGVTHGSSNLLNLNLAKINLKVFMGFWKRYYPHGIRTRVVFRGEHKLSKVIGHSNLAAASTVLSKDTHSLTTLELNQLYLWIQRSRPDVYQVLTQDVLNSTKEQVSFVVHFAAENFQISNTFGLYLARRYFFPLKLDLPYYQLTTKSAMLELMRSQDCGDEEVLKIRSILEGKGSMANGGPIIRILKSYQII